MQSSTLCLLMSQLDRKYRDTVERLRGQRDALRSAQTQAKAKLDALQQQRVTLLEAQALVHRVAQETQSQLKFHLTELVSMAMAAVFDDPYKLDMAFEVKNNRTQVSIMFTKDGEMLVAPRDASGGGAADIAAFALRIACLSLSGDKYRRTILMDEPFTHLSENYQAKASQMMQQLAARYGLQFIIVTHEDTLIEYADTVFRVKLGPDRVSNVVRVSQ